MTRRDLLTALRTNFPLLGLLVALVAAFGWAWQSPAQQLGGMRLTIDTLRAADVRLDAVIRRDSLARHTQADSMFRLLRQLQAASCLQGDARDLSLIGIPCSSVVARARQEARQ